MIEGCIILGLIVLACITQSIISINKLRDKAHLMKLKRNADQAKNQWTR
jgi:mannose/fructose/N-acetylgalactosamine-specific phosphotransferase system component IID